MSNISKDNHMRKLSFLGFNRAADGDGNPDEVQLDAEMDKVFADKEKFDVNQFSDKNDKSDRIVVIPTKYTVEEYDDHRKKSHQQKKGTHKSGSMKRDSPSSSTTTTGSPTSSPTRINANEEEPLVSERAGYTEHHSDSSNDARRVQFDKKKTPKKAEIINIPENDSYDDENEDNRRRKGRHQHYKNRKYSLEDNRGYRRQSGSDSTSNGQRRVSVQPEDQTLEEADIDELTSHRSDDTRGMRRSKVQTNERQQSRRDKTQNPTKQLSPLKKRFDHSPHEVFVQLDELQGIGEDREWKETARWIKYEEDVEEGSDRWGRPHVASLSFHSLLNLRRCLETGVVLMDLEERDLPGVAYRVVEQMAIEELITDDDKPTLLRSLLLRHRHVNEHSGGFPFGKKKFNSYTSLQNLSDNKPKIVPSSEINGHGTNDTRIDIKEETYSSSQEDLKKVHNDTILKRIPQGAEATTVLVGAVDFLNQPTIAFVRLAEGIPIPGVTEVPIPVRFIFILLGPKTVELDYHEVGRSIATLMSNEQFHKIAYKADDRRDLLSAINEFLDDSIVLPPGNWQRTDLLPFDDLKARNEWIRTRKDNALKEKNKDKQAIIDEEKKLLGGIGGGGGGDGDDGDNGDGDGKKKPPVGPLEKTNRLWGGLINDIKRRMPMYKSDILDGLNTETLAATLFMYFAALSTAITFGGLSSAKTHDLIGISETLLAASAVGMVFHAFSGQPLVIIGTTGPLLLFDEALYEFCMQMGYNFLTTRVYVGIWMGIIALAVSAFEGSVYVRLFTRFTQEIFSALITLIYIVETALKLVSIYQRHPLYANYSYAPESQQQLSSVAEALTATTTEFNGSDNETFTTVMSTVVTSTASTILSTVGATNATTVSTTLLGNASSDMTSILLNPSDAVGPLNQPNTALFCTLLTLATFTVAYYLKMFRNSHFLGRNARRALGDFGVPISIAIFVFVDYMLPQVFTDKLTVPEGISPSLPNVRGWLIPLGGVPLWLPFAAGIPAILVYILAFMESHISELIVDKPERGLKKGSGLHLDIVILCLLNVVCGFFGMPWHCAATVRSVTHVSAVTIMSKTHAPGDKPHIVDVKEQRISGFVVSLLVGLSVTMAPILRLIPMSVLFGVFLYMGIVSMMGVQFFDRLRLFFMPVKYHPQEAYVRRVPTWKMHIFTTVQILALATLWAVKSSSFSLAFPFVLVLMVPLRQKIEVFFTPQEIEALDGSPPKVEPDDEPDFYEQAPIPA